MFEDNTNKYSGNYFEHFLIHLFFNNNETEIELKLID